MYRCPRCHVELAADARFCKHCGFNQTNARIASVQPPMQETQRQVPSEMPQGGQQAPTRMIQPQHKYVSEQAAQYGQQPQGNNGLQQPVQNAQSPASAPQGDIGRTSQPPASPPGQALRLPSNHWIPEQIVRTSTPPTRQFSLFHTSFEPLRWGLGALPDTPVSVESLEATSKAAQHWRQSWLDRQQEEAGPAIDVSRGQSSVPEPLISLKDSLGRIRGTHLPQNGVAENTSRVRFWLPVLLLMCLIGGLGLFILSTYADTILNTSASANASPTLTIKNAKTTTVAAGQTIQVHGEHFGTNDTIRFYLDAIQLQNASGKPVVTQSDDKGVFDASLSIPATQLAGEYAMQAVDDSTGQHAFLDIYTTAKTTTNVATLSVAKLTFAAKTGHDPRSQNVTITNTGNTPISWSVITTTNDQAHWLSVANNATSGQLAVGQTDTIGVVITAQGLTSSPAGSPYTGEVVFMILQQGQVVLPVTFTLTDINAQVITTPNPLLATQSNPGGCQPDTSITLINLSGSPINWGVQTNGTSRQVIVLDGQGQENGQLAPSGNPKDTRIIMIGCNGIQLNKQYTINVSYNGIQQLVPITVMQG